MITNSAVLAAALAGNPMIIGMVVFYLAVIALVTLISDDRMIGFLGMSSLVGAGLVFNQIVHGNILAILAIG